jgi:hypothetical protein
MTDTTITIRRLDNGYWLTHAFPQASDQFIREALNHVAG